MPVSHDLREEFAWDQPASGFTEGASINIQDTTESREELPDREALRRALRDLEAAEARVLRTAERVYDESRAKLVLDIVPVLDDLDRTIRAAEQRSDPGLLDGVRMVRAHLEQVLVRFGVDRIDATGVRFDPALHDAIEAAPVDDPTLAGVVIRQLEPGYSFNRRLIRPARVTVGVRPTT